MKEILAPVGSKEMLISAINSGADAVYLGASKFNARMKADNFDSLSLKESVRLAHLFNVKVYLTLNTLVNDSEIPSLIDTINEAVDAKVDAFIVQDYGTSYIIKKYYPNAVLHASTQLGVHNKEGALVAKQMGFSRVVLSREATLEDIRQIKQATGLEIEYFVHGALCVAFSGNCYLSSFVKNKSGNRGECLQLCRLFYTAKKDSVDGYLLSTRDLCYLDKMQELANNGVDSFKIEGRLKRPSYVALTTYLYKKAILGQEITKQDEENLRIVFSRGEFNKGRYLDNQNSNIINKQTQSHQGLKIGKVIKAEKFKDLHKIFIKTSHNLIAGDGLKFVSTDNFVNSMGVGNVERIGDLQVVYSKCYPSQNDDVYLTVDSNLESKILSYTRKIKVDFNFVANVNEKAKLTVSLCDKSISNQDLSVAIESDKICEPAKNSSVSKENVIKSLSKLGDTNFSLNKINVVISDNLFLPLVEINNLRRNCVSKLQDLIIETNSPKLETNVDKQTILNELIETKSQFETIKDKFKTINDKMAYIHQNNDNIDNNADIVIISPEIYSTDNIKNIVDTVSQKNKKAKLYLDLPIIECYKDMEILNNILKDNNDLGVVVNNIYGINLVKGRDVILGVYLNISNSFAYKHLVKLVKENGCKLNKYDNVLAFRSKEYFSECDYLLDYQDKLALMTIKHCPFKVCYNTNCNNCSYDKGLCYKMQSGQEFVIKRKKIFNCYFALFEK